MGNIPGWEAFIKCVTCTGGMVRTDPASDCVGAIPLCSDQTVIVSTNQYDDTGNEDDDVGSCFSGTGNGGSVWYTFSPQANGNLDFYINPSGSTDYDFVLYDATNGCNDLQEMSCNFSATYGNTGMTTNSSDYQNSYNGCGGNEYNSAPQDCGVWNEQEAVNTTHTYMLMVNFYGGSNDGFTLQFQNDPGTVSIMDNTPPTFTEVSQPGCNGSQVQVSFSENIDCTTLDASDFTILGYTVTIANSGCSNNMTQSVTLNISPVLPNGTYTLSGQDMTDMCGNPLNDNILITISTTTVSVIITGSDFCAGSSSTLTTAVTGVAPLTYTWDDGSHNSSLTVTTAGTYCVTVSDVCSSTANDCQIINTISAPVINTSYSCNGSDATLSVTGCTGTIQWQEWGDVPSSTPITNAAECTACGGTPNLLFGLYISCSIGNSCPSTILGWVNIGTASSINVTPPYATQYQATCTGSGGCNAQSVVLVDCNTPLSVSVNSATVCTGNCANITATPSGGTAPITYAWSTGGFTGAGPHNVCPTGTTTYTVTATDAGGITAIASGIVTVNPASPVNAGLDVSICTGNSTTITATGAITYLWDNGLGAGSSHTVSPATTTTYSVTGTDANNCTATDVITITVGANLTPTITGNLVICSGSSTTLDAGAGYLSYQWSTNVNTQNINVTTAGNYSVTVTGTGGCTGSASVNVTVNPCSEICDNGIDDDGDGLIDLNDTTDCNCLGINTTQQSSLIPNHSFEEMNCCPESFSQVDCATGWIQATSATSDYQNTCGYVFGAVTNANLVPFPDGNGILGCISSPGWQEYVGSCLTATMTAGNSYDMTFDIATVLIDGMGDTPISILPGGISGLENIDITIYGNTLCSAMPISTTGCPSSADLSWVELGHVSYDPASNWESITMSLNPSFNINAIILGSPCTLPATWMAAFNNYSNLVYSVFDDLMLTETTNHSFTTQTIGSFCNNDLILYAQLTDTISNPQWQWYKDSVALVGETNDTLYFSQNNYSPGEYEIRLTVNADCEIQVITISPENMTPQINYTTTCAGYQVSFSGSINGGVAPTSWQWLIDGNTYNLQNPVVDFTSSGVYNAQLIVQGINPQCTDTTSTTINLLPFLQLDLGIDSICYYSPTTITATNGFDLYQWSTGDTTQLINIPAPGTYVCTVSTINQSNNIINGDFEQGNTGFSSSYIYNGNGVVAGHYGIVTNTAVNDTFWAPCLDHTSGTGNVMIIDGADQPDVPVWCQTVNVAPNTDYIFNTWITSIQANNPAILQFSVNGISLNQPFNASSTLCNWTQFFATWNSGSNTSANICIVNQSTATEGNDFALDDIFFGEICTQTDSVVYLPQPQALFSVNDTCVGLAHFYQDQSISTEGTIHNWQWNFGDGETGIQQNPQHIYTNAGLFTTQLIATDIHGCSDTSSTTVTSNPNPIANAGNDTSICLGFSALLSATGGNTFHWNNGIDSATNSVSPALTTIYSVTATDVNGCTASDSVTVTVNQNTSAYAGNDTAVCLGFSTLLSATGGNTYHWSNGDSTVSITVSPVATTIYTVTATDGNGCSDSDSVTVTINQNTSAYVENAVICNGDSAILIASGGISYLWSNGSNSASTTVHPVLTTVYILTATDSNGCSDTTSATDTVNQNPVVSITGTNSTCFGFNNGIAAATVTGGAPGYTYLWSNSLVTQDVSALAVGIYTVTVTDANNCTGMNTVTITEPPALVIITSPDQLICNGQSVPVSVIATGGTGIYSYHWSTGATTQQITIQPITNTTYSVFITDANGCVSATGSTIVNVLPPLNIVLFTNQDTICPGNPISISALVSGGDGGPYYLYNSNNELIDNPYIVYPVGASNYIIIAKDGCGTSVRDTVHVALYPVPEATFTADKMSGCVPLTVYFLPMVFQPGFQYSWSFGENQSISTSGNPSHIFQSPGSYDISLTVENQYGCTSTETISHMINAYPVPLASFNANPITTSILKPEIEFYNNSDGAVNYLWSFGDGDSSNNINPVHNYPAPGNYTIQMIAVSNHGCKDSISMTVMVNDEFTFYAPNYFSPDGDGINDVFKVFGYGIDNSYFKLYIYDRWGEIIFISTDIEEGWNGYVGSKMSQNGTYTWLVNFKKISGVSVTKYGAANLIR